MTQPREDLLPTAAFEPGEVTGQLPTVSGDTTLPRDDRPTSSLPAVPGYAIEAVLGRGGMGVVYRARHLALKRVVALKMILAGVHADEQERARFKAEAEAVGRLNHPNIVQVYEVGEHEGLPFCALEFVDGGSLASKLGGKPLSPQNAATLVETLARAMHLAHSRNVIHRDLKPANILLTAEGQPKVTDFGLARQLDEDSERTQVGMLMGTPSYMAPEQAAGRAHDAGPAADVWALGAILYECLTGKPPFKGATVRETLEQVLTREPVAPHALNRGVPRDLETICLKCLRKEPERRYASAQELADDLARFLRGEPVQARPVGTLERGWRWCRRNPALTLALLATVLSLVGGIVTASWFAVVAWREKLEAEKKTDEYVGMVAQSLLTPLAKQPVPLTAHEVDALQRVGAKRGGLLAPRCVREALTDPDLSPTLRVRGAYIWQAAVGLDRHQRDEAERLLLEQLREATGERQVDLAWGATTLGSLSPETARAAAEVLLSLLRQAKDAAVMKRLTQGLAGLLGQMDPATARTTSQEILAILNRTLEQSPNSVIFKLITEAEMSLADVLEPEVGTGVATEAASILSRRFEGAANRLVMVHAVQGLTVVVPRMKPAEAAAILIRAEIRTKDTLIRKYLIDILRNITRGMTAREASVAAAGLLGIARTATDARAFREQAVVLGGLAHRMDSAEATEVARVIAARLDQLLDKKSDILTLVLLSEGLEGIADLLPAEEALAASDRLAEPLLQELARPGTKDPTIVQGLLALVSPRNPEGTRRVATALARAIGETTSLANVPALVQQIALVAGMLDWHDAETVGAEALVHLIRFLDRKRDEYAARDVCFAIEHLDPHISPAAATEAARSLIRILQQTPMEGAWGHIATCLAGVARRMEYDEAKTFCAQVAPALLQLLPRALESLRKNGDSITIQNTIEGLGLLSPWLTPQQRTEASAAITEAMTHLAGGALVQGQAQALAALGTSQALLAVRMPAEEAMPAASRAAGSLVQALNKAPDATSLQWLTQGLDSLSPWLGPKEASVLVAVHGKASEPETVHYLSWALNSVLAREPASVAAKRPALVAALVSQPPSWSLLGGAGGLRQNLSPPPLPVPVLVELLKGPLCVGAARRSVLDQLSRHHGRSFADQWDFVIFAEERHLDLDLLTPPKSP
jgi:hypothetical protein